MKRAIIILSLLASPALAQETKICDPTNSSNCAVYAADGSLKGITIDGKFDSAPEYMTATNPFIVTQPKIGKKPTANLEGFQAGACAVFRALGYGNQSVPAHSVTINFEDGPMTFDCGKDKP